MADSEQVARALASLVDLDDFERFQAVFRKYARRGDTVPGSQGKQELSFNNVADALLYVSLADTRNRISSNLAPRESFSMCEAQIRKLCSHSCRYEGPQFFLEDAIEHPTTDSRFDLVAMHQGN